jgi:hypothetical protein
VQGLLVRDIIVLGLEESLEAHHDRKGVQVVPPSLFSLSLSLLSFSRFDIVSFWQPKKEKGLLVSVPTVHFAVLWIRIR